MHGIRGVPPVTLGVADRQGNLLDDMSEYCERVLAPDSIYAFLHRERDRLFPDGDFADLYQGTGRCSVPPSVVASVMVLQRLEGLSDREAVERYAFDARWRYACGVGSYDTGGWSGVAHTVLVETRMRLRGSGRPDRVFEVVLDAARAAGLVGRKRVLDSTPLHDAVATMDTITLIRSAIRALLRVADAVLRSVLRAVISSGDDYASSSKPQVDWDDREAHKELIDSRAEDGYALIMALCGRELTPAVTEAAALLCTVLGQDLEATEDGTLAIARRVAADRVISVVDPETRHGHKSSAHGFDGYKGHVAVDPDSEIITATTVSAGNVADGSVAADLIADLLADDHDSEADSGEADSGEADSGEADSGEADSGEADSGEADSGEVSGETGTDGPDDAATVYGDCAYGTGAFQDLLDDNDIESRAKTQDPVGRNGLFAKDRFDVDVEADTVTCPAGVTVDIGRHDDGSGTATFAGHCAGCPLRDQCTQATAGRTVSVGVHEEILARSRARQKDPGWAGDYRATRPKVERKLGHLMRRKHGGRRARVRGRRRVGADFSLLAAAVNLARLATLGVSFTVAGWNAPAA
jgi:hypothetical protein